MKFNFALLLTFTVSFLLGQDKKCYDISWKEVKCSEDYNYYRIIPSNKISDALYKVKDYYKNGTLQMEGAYSDSNYLHKTGVFKYYYEDGKISAVENYLDNKNFGEFKKWYPNGQLKFEGTYTEPDGEEIYTNFWFEDGVQSIKNGEGAFTEKDEDGSFSAGSMKGGKKDGIWKGYMQSVDIKYEEEYDKGLFLKGISTNNSKKYNYTILQEIPYPQKGDNDLRSFVSKNFIIPNKIAKNSYSDAVTLVIVIDELGNIFDVSTENITDEKVKERLIKTVKKYPGKFILPKIRGVAVKQKLRLPIVLIVD